MKSDFKEMPGDTGLDDSIVSIRFIKADTVDVSRLGQCFSNFFFSHSTFSIPNMLTYCCHNTKHVSIPLGTANINAYFQDTGLPGCFATLREHQI